MKNRITSLLYRIIKFFVRLFYPKLKVYGAEHLPDGPAVIVGNHAQMNGPIGCELYSPRKRYTWCTGEMMHLKEVPAYAYRDFWSEKPKYSRWFYKLLSYVIAPFSVCVFNNAETIGVYHDARILSTFKTTVSRLEEGADVVIFPEHDVDYNHILCDFQDRFVDIAKRYYRKTKEELAFVPLYVAPSLKSLYYGEAIRYSPENSMEEERSRICSYLKDSITSMAESLPEHRVVPYRNIPRKDYPLNIRKEADNADTDGGLS